MPEPIEKLPERMAPLLQPGVAEGVEGLVFGCDGGLAGAAVNLVNGGRSVAASRHQGSDASFHDQLNFIMGLVLKELNFVRVDTTQTNRPRHRRCIVSEQYRG